MNRKYLFLLLFVPSDMPIDLYYVPGSAPCRAVLLTAKALNLNLNLKLVDLHHGEHLKPEYLKVRQLLPKIGQKMIGNTRLFRVKSPVFSVELQMEEFCCHGCDNYMHVEYWKKTTSCWSKSFMCEYSEGNRWNSDLVLSYLLNVQFRFCVNLCDSNPHPYWLSLLYGTVSYQTCLLFI